MVGIELTILGWVVVACFFASTIYDDSNRYFRTMSWTLFAVYCVAITPHFWFVQKSLVETVLALAGAGIGVYVAILQQDGTVSLDRISLWIAVTGAIILSVNTIPFVRGQLITVVARNTSELLQTIGFDTVTQAAERGRLIVFQDTQPTLKTRLVIACTGVGSVSIFIGLASVLDTSVRNRVGVAVLSTLTIYILNIARNVFIAGAYGGQWFDFYPNMIGWFFGTDGYLVSYYIADRVISQFASLIVLVALGLLILQFTSRDDELVQELVSLYNQTVGKK